jgi:alkanesulfonate monooxygenase SsuD/methylene tetrahydromethanopterin reductase-like flavin-dependent oxidoreductase (luciferase family)
VRRNKASIARVERREFSLFGGRTGRFADCHAKLSGRRENFSGATGPNASKSGRAQVLKLAEQEKLTVRQLAQRYGGYSGLACVGTPETIADEMQAWLSEEASDGCCEGQRDGDLDPAAPETDRRSG